MTASGRSFTMGPDGKKVWAASAAGQDHDRQSPLTAEHFYVAVQQRPKLAGSLLAYAREEMSMRCDEPLAWHYMIGATADAGEDGASAAISEPDTSNQQPRTSLLDQQERKLAPKVKVDESLAPGDAVQQVVASPRPSAKRRRGSTVDQDIAPAPPPHSTALVT